MNKQLNQKYRPGSVIFLAIVLLVLLTLSGCVKGATPVGWSGTVISNGTLYAGSKEGRLVSVKLEDGTRIWSDPLKPNGSSGSAIYGTPTLATVPDFGDSIYVAGYNGKIMAYDPATLQPRWVYPVEGNLKAVVSTIAFSDDAVYFGGTDGNVYALDAATGQKRWQFTTGGEIWSSPVLDNNILIISSFDKKIYGLNATSGQKIWEYATLSTNVAVPLVVGGIAYVGSLDQYLYALNEKDGTLLWKFKGSGWFWAKPAVFKGTVYAPNLDGRVYGLDSNTGVETTSYTTGGQISSSPVIVADRLMVATQNGKLLSLDLTGSAMTLTRTISIAENITAPLSVANNRIYINAPDNVLYIYDASTGTGLVPILLKSP